MRARTRAKNEAHGGARANLCDRPPVTDAFGKAGRRWLAATGVARRRATDARCPPASGRLPRQRSCRSRSRDRQARSCLAGAPASNERPGVNCRPRRRSWPLSAISAASPRRASSWSYLGLDPRVRQSGAGRAHHGRISKAGRPRPAHARRSRLESYPHPAPCERSSSGYAHAAARRSPQRQPPASSLCSSGTASREQDYAFARPAMTRNKIRGRAARRRTLPKRPQRRRRRQIQSVFDAEPELPPSRDRLPPARQRLDRERAKQRGGGCGRDTGARISEALKGKAARQASGPNTCASLRQSPTPTTTLAKDAPPVQTT